MNYNVLIVGSGPVGVSLAANLSSNGLEVYLQSREGLVKDAVGYRQFEKSWVYDVKLKHPKSYDIAFICTKAYDIESAIKSHKEVLLKSSRIVFMTNGYTKMLVNKSRSLLPGISFEFGVTDRAVVKNSVFQFEAKSRLGSYYWSSGELLDIEKYLMSENPDLFRITKDHDLFLRKKWILNVVINSITAAHLYKKNGSINVSSKEFSDVFAEAFSLSEKLFPNTDFDKRETFKSLLDLIEATKDNFNSMAYDRSLGRETESEFLAGISLEYDNYPTLAFMHKKISGLL